MLNNLNFDVCWLYPYPPTVTLPRWINWLSYFTYNPITFLKNNLIQRRKGMEKRAKKYDPENQPYTDILITCTDPLCSRWHANVAALRVLYLRLCSLHSYVKFFFLGCFFPFRVSYSLNPPPDVYIFVLLCTIVISLVQLVLSELCDIYLPQDPENAAVFRGFS